MKRIAIYGAGGFGREVRAMLEVDHLDIEFAGYIDDFRKNELGIELATSYDDVLLAIAHPGTRIKIIENWNDRDVSFCFYRSRDVVTHHSVSIGKGSIICAGVRFTTSIDVGKFVIINLNSTIGHDCTIADYVSIMPSVNLSGNVKISRGVFLGTGSTILQGITIGENSIVGAGTLVNKDIPANCTVVGVPGRIIKQQN